MIEYKEFDSSKIGEVYEIYKENHWGAYLNDLNKLKRAFANSLYVLGAFDGGKLVGFIRCIGDQEYIIYIQDLIVLPNYQRCGIGKELIMRVSRRYKDIRQFVLITDENDSNANAFYQSIGLKRELNGQAINCYFRVK